MDGGCIDILMYLDGVDLSDIFGEFKENVVFKTMLSLTCVHECNQIQQSLMIVNSLLSKT